MSEKAVELSPSQVAELIERLAEMRHNVNNSLALLVAAGELAQRKTDLGGRFADTISAQPERISKEIRTFSNTLEQALGVNRSEPNG